MLKAYEEWLINPNRIMTIEKWVDFELMRLLSDEMLIDDSQYHLWYIYCCELALTTVLSTSTNKKEVF